MCQRIKSFFKKICSNKGKDAQITGHRGKVLPRRSTVHEWVFSHLMVWPKILFIHMFSVAGLRIHCLHFCLLSEVVSFCSRTSFHPSPTFFLLSYLHISYASSQQFYDTFHFTLFCSDYMCSTYADFHMWKRRQCCWCFGNKVPIERPL